MAGPREAEGGDANLPGAPPAATRADRAPAARLAAPALLPSWGALPMHPVHPWDAHPRVSSRAKAARRRRGAVRRADWAVPRSRADVVGARGPRCRARVQELPTDDEELEEGQALPAFAEAAPSSEDAKEAEVLRTKTFYLEPMTQDEALEQARAVPRAAAPRGTGCQPVLAAVSPGVPARGSDMQRGAQELWGQAAAGPRGPWCRAAGGVRACACGGSHADAPDRLAHGAGMNAAAGMRLYSWAGSRGQAADGRRLGRQLRAGT